jgi:CMP-N,N'-diacetyllegionaminic acid synthase
MIYMIDIDGTICNTPKDKKGNNAYKKAIPIKERIEQFNLLFEAGHEVHYWTARGSASGKDWTDLTVKQLSEWGVKATSLSLGKPSYDVWIDDKAIHPDQL